MKKLIKPMIVSFMIFSLLIGCKKEKKEDQIQVNSTEQRNNDEEKTDDTSKKDCDDFLKEYEKWMDDVVEVMAKHKDNPAGLIGDPDYTKSMLEASNWATEWMQKSTVCARDSKYQKKFDAIQKRMEEKMQDLGLN